MSMMIGNLVGNQYENSSVAREMEVDLAASGIQDSTNLNEEEFRPTLNSTGFGLGNSEKWKKLPGFLTRN